MGRKAWRSLVEGTPLPPPLANIQWTAVPGQLVGPVQEYGEGPDGADWRREGRTTGRWEGTDDDPQFITEEVPGFSMWVHLPSEYREGVILHVYLWLTDEGMVEDVTI